MKKYILPILIIIVLIIVFLIFFNKNRSNNLSTPNKTNENTVDMQTEIYTSFDNYEKTIYLDIIEDFPIPDNIIFHYNNDIYKFNKNSDEYNKILELNSIKIEKLNSTRLVPDIDRYLGSTNVLEYSYKNAGSIYFVLKPNSDRNDIFVKDNTKTFANLHYAYENSLDELINYLNTIV